MNLMISKHTVGRLSEAAESTTPVPLPKQSRNSVRSRSFSRRLAVLFLLPALSACPDESLRAQPAAEAQTVVRLTLDECIEQAKANNRSLAAAEKQLREKDEHLREVSQLELSAKETVSAGLADKRYRLAVLASNIDVAQKDIKTNENSIVSLGDGIESRNKYIAQVRFAIDGMYATLNESVTDSKLQEEMAQLLEKIKQSDTYKQQLDEDFKVLSESRMTKQSDASAKEMEMRKQEYDLNKIDDDLLALQQRVLEDYNITYSAAMQYKDENFRKETAQKRITQLKSNITGMGIINPTAPQKLEVEQARYDELTSQLEDLDKAEVDLKNALSELESNIESRFNDGMEQINDNFKLIFRELFSGGNARLYIDRDPAKASLDQGIEIEAQPPGKKLQNISLLSGGERTMTAAAILFAILKFNPMPFCVLDEIEAALDDANAERISKYLRKFSSSTQFVVITHKKPTMEHSDVLYGVTMEEKGVSKIVSVKLTDAIKQAM